MNARLTKNQRILKLKDFRRVNSKGRRLFSSNISLTITPNSLNKTRLGITVTKKFGKSHDRNRFKRLVREAYRLNYQKIPVGLDLVVRPKSWGKETKGCRATLRCIEKELVSCCSNLSASAK